MLSTNDKIDHYLVLEKIRESSIALLYRARDLNSGRDVVLKMLSPQAQRQRELRKRFHREGEILAHLSSNSIVRLLDANSRYIAMEYIEGMCLRDLLTNLPKTGRPLLPVSVATYIFAQIAKGLADVHRQGYVHCDINPSNIMLACSGKVILIDFGLARKTGEQVAKFPWATRRHSSPVIGNPAYMAPEQILRQPVDQRTDIYALGSVLYELLTGRPPFEGRTLEELLSAILLSAPPDPKQLRPQLPSTLADITLKMLNKSPERRY